MDPNQSPRLPRSVLFTCNENAVRSPMAEGLARAYFKRRIFVASAGIIAGQLDPFSVEVMRGLNIDISNHQPKTFDDVAEEDFALVISLTPEAQHHAVELTRNSDAVVEYWPTFDPTIIEGSRQSRLDAYIQVRDALRKRIIERFNF